MHFNQFSLLVFATGTGLCNASLLRRTSQPSPISVALTTIPPLSSSPTSPTSQPEVTTSPGVKTALIAGILTIGSDCNGFVLSASSAVYSSLASNASAQIVSFSTAAAASISIAQASAAAADASASDAIASVQSSAAAALGSASAEITSIKASASSELSAVSASLISVNSLATYSAQAAALALGAAATESAWAISSQLADANTAVQFSKATTIPMTVAVVLILGTSFASSVLSVLIYRFFSRRKMKRERERENEIRETQNEYKNYRGGMEKNTGSYGDPNPGDAQNYPASTSRSDRSSVSTSYNQTKYASRYMNSHPEEEIMNRDYVEGDYERGDEDNYSRHAIIDIEKEIAEMDYQMKMAEAELERRDRERSIRISESGLSRSSKSISVLFTPRDTLQGREERRGSNARSVMSTSMGIGEKLMSMVMPSYRQSQAPSVYESSTPTSPFSSTKDYRRNSTGEIGDRELEEGEEIIFTLDERPPSLPKSTTVPRATHAYTHSDSSIMTLSPSVYDGGSSNGKKKNERIRVDDSPTIGREDRGPVGGKGPYTFSIGKAF
ncbi:e8587cc6-38df-496e-ad86-30fb8c9cf2cd [Sclerotinia trifoliorum]|uniref:E8587cc6-38df-496e-ad86-30fb8c9cf2cd n=1 Tax=Sclerotinia trifoliorum TaxID=28548 RepID=A0A8H2VVF6_9HELO|nr:e8587cc6-38df-496e-ad86-30fb8c9cf2cd [Sclerotinia trifoliorum]